MTALVRGQHRWAQPTVAGETLFVGSQNGTVYALDPKSGCIIWTFTVHGGVRASISIEQRSQAYFRSPTATARLPAASTP